MRRSPPFIGNHGLSSPSWEKSLQMCSSWGRFLKVKTKDAPKLAKATAKGESVSAWDAQAKFLMAALLDAQAVIRATDYKVAALFFGLALPLTKLGSIWRVCIELISGLEGAGKFSAQLIVLIFSISWLISIAAALRTLLHIDNPAKHVAGDKPSGVFYSPALFRVSLLDVFFPARLDSALQFSAFFSSLPSGEEQVCRELAFELMKLIYIRTVKLKRAFIAYTSFSAWILAGGGIWVVTLFLRIHGK